METYKELLHEFAQEAAEANHSYKTTQEAIQNAQKKDRGATH